MLLQDTLTNLVSGLGTEKDKITHGRFVHRVLSQTELHALYTSNWLAGTIVDAPADDMTREWRNWQAGPRQIQAIAATERRLKVRQTVNQWLKLGRLYGGAALLIGVPGSKPDQPLDLNSVTRGSLAYVHALSRWEIATGPLERDPQSENFGAPAYYELNAENGGQVRIHPSRVIRSFGQAKLEIGHATDGWGLSTLHRVYESVRDVAATAQATAGLIQQAQLDIIKVPGLTERVQDVGYRAKVIARFGLAQQAKSIVNAVLLDQNEEWTQRTQSYAGLPEVLLRQLEMASGAANIPLTRLLGTSAKGLNATGNNEVRNYYDMLAARQEVDLRPALEVLDEVLIRSALGSRPGNVWYSWKPLWQMTEAEAAAIALQKAQTAQIYGVLGAMPPSALRSAIQNMLVESGAFPGLAGALELALANGEPAAPLLAKSDAVDTNSPKQSPAAT